MYGELPRLLADQESRIGLSCVATALLDGTNGLVRRSASAVRRWGSTSTANAALLRDATTEAEHLMWAAGEPGRRLPAAPTIRRG